MSRLKVNKKEVTITDKEMVERMIEDIRECDSDMFEMIVESMYPVKAKCEDGLVTIKLDSNEVGEDVTFENIF